MSRRRGTRWSWRAEQEPKDKHFVNHVILRALESFNSQEGGVASLDCVFLKSTQLAAWRIKWEGLERKLEDPCDSYRCCPGERQDKGQTRHLRQSGGKTDSTW